jgi:excalibur calcium-binding domain-containing protein
MPPDLTAHQGSRVTNPPTSKQTKQTAAGLAVLFALCCGGAVGINSAFSDDDKPDTAATTPVQRFVDPAADQAAVTTAPALPQVTETTVEPEPEPTTVKPKPKATTKKPKPKPAPTSKKPTAVYYKNCDAVRAAGADPIHRGDPGYAKHLDRDGDGVGCE